MSPAGFDSVTWGCTELGGATGGPDSEVAADEDAAVWLEVAETVGLDVVEDPVPVESIDRAVTVEPSADEVLLETAVLDGVAAPPEQAATVQPAIAAMDIRTMFRRTCMLVPSSIGGGAARSEYRMLPTLGTALPTTWQRMDNGRQNIGLPESSAADCGRSPGTLKTHTWRDRMRARIIRLTVALAALTIALFGVPLGVAVAQYLLTDRYKAVEQTADAAALAAAGDLTNAPPPPAGAADDSTQVGVYNANGFRVSGTGPDDGVQLISDALRGVSSNGVVDGRLGVAAPVSDGDAIVGAVLATTSRSAVYAEIGGVWLGMIGLAAAALVIAWLLARRQAGHLVSPLQALSGVAERLGSGDFSVRTQPAGIPEIDSLNESVNRTATRLGALVDRERSFSADASHQLRTPLTGLRLQLEIALDQPGTDLRAAVVDALTTTDRLESTIDDLLALARDLPQPSTTFDANGFLHDLRLRWHPLLAARGRPLRVIADSTQNVQVHAAALTQIMDVLLDNAVRHGQGTVTVTVRGLEMAVSIDVADEGPPLALDPAELFERQTVRTSGHGIGLALARRLAESGGGRLRLTSSDPPTFTLLLPVTNPARPAAAGPAKSPRQRQRAPGPPS